MTLKVTFPISMLTCRSIEQSQYALNYDAS